MKFKVVLFLFFTALFMVSCTESERTWKFKVRNKGVFPDAFFLSADFRPLKYEIKAKGILTGNAKLQYNQINDSDTSDMVIREYFLPKGKIDTTFKGDVYVKQMSIIYLPEREASGSLSFDVTIK